MTAVGLRHFVLVGVARSGTTSLYHYLRQHPDICVSDIKEINFLAYPGAAIADTQYPWLRFPVRTLDDYRALFAGANGRVPVDFSASCFHSPFAISRIREYLPAAGLFVLLRDPVARAYSAYLNRVNKGYETRPPAQALVPGERAVDNGCYYQRLTDFRDAFGAERMRVWLFDDLSRRPRETLREIFGYLHVDPAVDIDTTAVHNRGALPRSALAHRLLPSYRARRRLADALPSPVRGAARRLNRLNRASAPPLPDDVAARLRRHYADDVARLADLIDRDLNSWLPCP
jgi:hypothetical protein